MCDATLAPATPSVLEPVLEPMQEQALEAVAWVAPIPRLSRGHSHERGQLFGASRGLLTVKTAQGQWLVPAIHAVWIPPHQSHALCSHGAFTGWSIYVPEDLCARLPAEVATLRTSGLLKEAVARVTSWPQGPRNPAERRVEELILDEIRTLPRAGFDLPMPLDARLVRIANHLSGEPADTRAIEAWAQWAHIPLRTLTRHFKLETGLSFNQWRQRARLMRALELLAAGTPVTTTALELGYDNVSAFIAMFRSILGVTPSRYLFIVVLPLLAGCLALG